jgi:methylamine dehydrogenase heavy chain
MRRDRTARDRIRRSLAARSTPAGLVVLAALTVTLAGVPRGAHAEAASVAPMPPPSDHWVFVPDRLIQHSLIFDGDSGDVVGAIDSPSLLTPKTPLLIRSRGEIVSADIAYSRGFRGERIDFVTLHDARTLDVAGEIVLPLEVGSSNTSQHYAELLGERFLAVFSQFPIPSVGIVDLAERRYVETIPIAGCSGIYPVSERRFGTLCGNGIAFLVELDETGAKARSVPSAPFFDPIADPVFMTGGRDGTRWTFVSFEGQVHTVDFSGDAPVAAAPWSLLSDAERAEGWRPGGLQHVALHAPTGRLFVAMHQGGGPGSHKEAGSEVWVTGMADHQRLERIPSPNLTASFLAGFTGIDSESFVYDLMRWLLPPGGVHSLVVSQDDAPLLFVRNAELGSVGVIDARSGEMLRFLTEAGLAGPTLRVP